MFLETWLTWITNHIGSTFLRNASGVRKDLVDVKKTKLDIKRLEKELDPPLIQPATLEDVKNYDPKYQQLLQHIKSVLFLIIVIMMFLLIAFFALDVVIRRTEELPAHDIDAPPST